MQSPPGIEAWDPWTARYAASVLAGVDRPWCVVGGHALDLWHGKATRSHEDLEVAVLDSDLDRWRSHLADYRLFSVKNGEVIEMTGTDQPIPGSHQTWLLEGQSWRMDLMTEPGDDQTWVYRRNPSMKLERSRAIRRSVDGIPYLCPEAVLLFKAKSIREKDEFDFELALPRLDEEARRWLAESIEQTHPGHAWTTRLIEFR